MAPDTSDWPCSKRRPRAWPTIRMQRRPPRPPKQAAIEQMWTYYEAAETLAKNLPSTTAQPLFYPAMNRIAAQLCARRRREALRRRWIMTRSHWCATRCCSAPPDFWSVVGQTELDMYVSIAAGIARARCQSPDRGLPQSPWARRQCQDLWSSVFDNATFVLSRYRTRAASSRSRCRRSAPRRARLAGGPNDATCVHGTARRRKRRPGTKGGQKSAAKTRSPRKSRPSRRRSAKRKT